MTPSGGQVGQIAESGWKSAKKCRNMRKMRKNAEMFGKKVRKKLNLKGADALSRKPSIGTMQWPVRRSECICLFRVLRTFKTRISRVGISRN